MRIMTRIGQVALEHLGESDDFTRCLHSLGDLSPDRRFIVHFPEENAVWSIGSGYGGNALLGKKCLALRLASWLGAQGRLARRAHADPRPARTRTGAMHYVAGAFPSACGKTNLAMLVPPAVDARLEGVDGRRRHRVAASRRRRPAVGGQPRGRASSASLPGTSRKTNPTAFDMIQRDTIYTNVALRPDGTPWWEGHDDPPPAEALDWQGRPWTPASAEKAAHPNSRFTTPATNCASLSPEFDNPERRADRRDPLRRAAAAARAARLRGAQLAARHVPRRDAVVGDDGRRDRQGRRAAPRSDGDAAVLRLQHGRLLRSTGSTSARR